MDWLLSALLIIGILAFFAQAILKIVSSNSSAEGTTTWKWQNLLSLVAGLCLCILLGLVAVWDFIQGQETLSSLLIGVALILVGGIMVWNSLSAIFYITAKTKWANLLLLIVGLLLILGVGYDLWLSSQGNGEGMSLQNLVVAIVALYITITGFRKLRGNEDEVAEAL